MASMQEMLLKSLLSNIDLPKLATTVASSPEVANMVAIATEIRDDFRTIKLQQAEILRRLDNIPPASDIAQIEFSPEPEKRA